MYIVKRVIVSVIVLIIGATSFWGVSVWAENPKTYTETISRIEDFQDNAIVLTGTATGMATVAAMVPGDTTTPLANKLADVAGYMVIVYAALHSYSSNSFDQRHGTTGKMENRFCKDPAGKYCVMGTCAFEYVRFNDGPGNVQCFGRNKNGTDQKRK